MTASQIVLSVAAALFVGTIFGAAIEICSRRRGELVNAALCWSRARERRQAAAQRFADHNSQAGRMLDLQLSPEWVALRAAERSELQLEADLADHLYALACAIRD